MEYQICEANSAAALRDEVRHLIAKGWRPSGGVSVAVSASTGGWWFYQAMVIATADSFPAADPEFGSVGADWDHT